VFDYSKGSLTITDYYRLGDKDQTAV
jgi:hypothetical protein